MTSTEHESGAESGESTLEQAARDGALPYAEQENEAAERGEEDSATTDPDADAEETGRGDLPGGIAMH